MFVYPQLPGGYVGVVHETDIIIAKREGRRCRERREGLSYQRVQFVDFLNGRLDITRVYGSPNLNPLLNRFLIRLQLDVGLDCEFICRRRIAVDDEVVHDQVIDITRNSVLAAVTENKSRRQSSSGCGCGSDTQVICVLLKRFQRDSQLDFKIHHVTGGPRAKAGVNGDIGWETGGHDSRLGRLHLVDLPLELVPCRRGRRGSARHLCSVKTPATTTTRRVAYEISRHGNKIAVCHSSEAICQALGRPGSRQPWEKAGRWGRKKP